MALNMLKFSSSKPMTSALISIEETEVTDKFEETVLSDTDKQNNNDEDDDNNKNEFGSFRIESVSVSDEKEELPDNARQQTNELVFKRAHTVMLTEEMQWFEDDYIKLEPLGEPGTFGMAFKCHKKTDSSIYYACKQINKAKFYFKEQKGILQNMKNEIEIMNVLSKHDNICKLHETYEDRNYIYLILDFLSGGELYAKIEENEELEEKQAQSITKQIFSAIQYMQQHNIAHLDLKPDNILFINDKTDSPIKIIDFGEARIVKNAEKLNQKIGTPYYMAPEIIRSIPYDPFSADMWSIGVIIFCMLFGFVPFHAEEEEEIFSKIKQGFKAEVCDDYGAFFPKDIPISDDAMDIIGGLLESNPSKRYTINDCLNHRWIKGDVVTVPKQKSFIAAKAKKQQSLKKLFLITEEPIDIEGTDNDEDESEGIGIDDVIDDEYVILNAPQNAIIKKGYLKKEGKLFKSWKKRYFILQNNGIVSYYYSNKDNTPIAEFSIKNYTKLIKSNKIKHGIILCTLQRNWKFICSNDKQRNEWIRAFEKAANNKKNKIKKTKNALKVGADEFNRIRRSIGNENDAISIGQLNRDQVINEKIDHEIDKQMKEMMDDLDIPQQARQGMLNLDKNRKIQMIQQHKFQKLQKKKIKIKEEKKKVVININNIDIEEKDDEKKQNGKHSHYYSHSGGDKKGGSLSPLIPSQTRPISVSMSLAQSSLSIKRKLSSASHSIFGSIKHEKIMDHLINATKSRLQIIKNDKEILGFIEKAFFIEKKEENNDEEEEEEDDDDINIDMIRSNSSISTSNYNGNNNHNISDFNKAKTIHFGRGNFYDSKKYQCRIVDNIAFSQFIEVIEFMLKELWEYDYTKKLYEKLIKRVSLTNKAKLFSIGADRRNRTYLFKKYNDCFVGIEGVDWLIDAKFVKNTDDKRERAKDLGNSFYTKGFIKHVANDHKFKDEKLWYHFNDALIDKQCLKEKKQIINNNNNNNHYIE